MEDNQAANAVIEEPVAAGIADPTPEPTEPIDAVPAPAVEPQQDVTQTQAFSKRLNEMTQKAIDAEYDRLYGDQYGIHTKAEYDAAIAKQQREAEAQQRGIDPAVYEQMTAAERKAAEAEAKATEALTMLNTYQRREELGKEAAMFAAHPKYGAFFDANKAAIMELANTLDPAGGSAQDALLFATKQVLADNWEPPKPIDEAAIKQRGVEEYLAKIKEQSIPVEARGGGIPSAPQSKDPWERARLMAEARLNAITE